MDNLCVSVKETKGPCTAIVGVLDGEASISAQKTALNKQKHYIENLKAFAEQVRYYPKNIDTIIQLHTIAIEAGKRGLI